MSLHQQLCLNHPQREAAARCPECRRYFCRECVVEHDDRILCAACLRKILHPEQTRRRWLHFPVRLAFACAGFLTAWGAYYWLGHILLSIPVSVHEGTLWKTSFWQE